MIHSVHSLSRRHTGYREDLDEASAKLLVQNAIRAGIFNDLGSGSNVDLCVIRRKDVEMLRNYEKPNEQSALRAAITRSKARDFKKGTTYVLSITITPHEDQDADASLET